VSIILNGDGQLLKAGNGISHGKAEGKSCDGLHDEIIECERLVDVAVTVRWIWLR